MKFAAKRAAASATAPHIAASMAEAKNCYWCGRVLITNRRLKRERDGRSSTREHLVPRSAGGTGSRENIVRACTQCNSARGNATDWIPWGDRWPRRHDYPERQRRHFERIGVAIPEVA